MSPSPQKSSKDSQPQPSPAEELVSLLHKEGVAEADISVRRRAEYSSDASNYRVVPTAVVFPHSAAEIEAAQAVSRATGVPLTARGGGTSVAGNAVGAGMVLDLSRHMNRLINFNEEEMTARVEPGMILDELQRYLSPKGLRFGPDPSTHARCTIGGMIGNNSCGSHSVAFGKTDENIAALELIDGSGRRFTAAKGLAGVPHLADFVLEHREIFASELGRFARQVSGYALHHLLLENGENLAAALVGSEGTCAIATAVTLKLVDRPAESVLAVLGYPDMATAADAAAGIAALGPQTVEGIDSRLVEVVKRRRKGSGISSLPAGGGWLLVETAGATLAEARAAANAVVAASGTSSSLVVEDPAWARELWRIRDDGAGLAGRTADGRPAWPGWEDAAVPPAVLGSYLRDFEHLMADHHLSGLIYGHFGDGCLHVRLDFDLADDPGSFRGFVGEAAQLVARYGGSISGEHGDGRARSELLPVMYSKSMITAFAEFKSLFDPQDLLNPGVLVAPKRIEEDLRLPQAHRMPRRGGFHLVADQGDFTAAVHRCVGVGKCRADNGASGGFMCPSFLATRDEKDSTRARARVLQEMTNGSVVNDGWRSPEVREVLDLCLSCKACARDCPAGVDMARYKSEVLYRAYRHRIRPASHYSLGWLPRWARLAALAPSLANGVLERPKTARLARFVAGVDKERSLPKFATKTFSQLPFLQAALGATGSPEVVLFVDTFTNHFAPEVASSAKDLLEAAGFRVLHAPPRLCCAITWISTGQLDTARRKLRRLVTGLAPFVKRGAAIVVLEPSCAAVMRGDLVELVAGGDAAAVASATKTLAEILTEAAKRLEAPWSPPDLSGVKVLVQPHCHQYAEMGFSADRKLLESSGAELEVLSGCCGMAGNFGMERGHRELSVAVANNALLPALAGANAATVVLADGFSCRTQIADLAKRSSIHLAQLMLMRSENVEYR